MLAGEENRAEGKDAEGKEGEASWGGRARSGSAGQRGASSGSAGGHGEGEGDPHVVVGGSDPGQLSGHTGSVRPLPRLNAALLAHLVFVWALLTRGHRSLYPGI